MKNIKSLINLIKTSTKAQIVTGAVAVAVVGNSWGWRLCSI